MMSQKPIHPIFNAAVIVSALGYFVDIYDLILFSIVRIPSLQSMGFEGEDLMHKGIFLLNTQMIGMLVGGVFWGILGDKKGRLSVLFGSIIMYSVANIANGMVNTIEAYAIWRFIAGVGLAGELGAGITLVTEILPKEKRGIGTTVVAAVGILGALLAALIAERFDWRIAFYIGGALGLLLLILRVSVYESGLFEKIEKTTVKRGDFFALFQSKERILKYVRCVCIGIPIWFVIGYLITFSPEFAKVLEVTEPVMASKAVMFCYLGLSVGDFASGLLSQAMRSRKRVVGAFLILTFGLFMYFLRARGIDANEFYSLCGALGFAIGYWAVFVTIGAEQFGTNLRATVTTTVPNFVRGSVAIISPFFIAARETWGIIAGAEVVGIVCLSIAFIALFFMEETFHKDLDYVDPV